MSFQVFDMEVTDEFVEYASEGSLAIEVWGNRMKGFDSQSKVMLNWNVEPQQKGLHDRYGQRSFSFFLVVLLLKFLFSLVNCFKEKSLHTTLTYLEARVYLNFRSIKREGIWFPPLVRMLVYRLTPSASPPS